VNNFDKGYPMPKYITKNQQIKDLKKGFLAAQNDAMEANKRVEDLEAQLSTLCNNADEAQRTRLAAVTYPQDNPKSVSWDDIAQYLGQVRKDDDSLHDYASHIAKQHDIDPTGMSVRALVESFGEKLLELGQIEEKIIAMGGKLSVEGYAMDILEGIEEKIEEEGMGSDVRTEAITLLKDLGFDTTIGEPNCDDIVLPLDDSQVVYALRQQLPRISN
jgi:hypothetical protein